MDGGTSPTEGIGVHSRACENCHKRKIRCDKLSPCSNCRSAKLTCRALQRKVGEQRQRIHVSSQYEQKINHIEEQLSSIHQILKTLTKNTTNIAQTESVAGPSTTFASLDDLSHESPLDGSVASDSPAFEGDSSLSAQSKFASRLLGEAVGQSPSAGLAPEIINALSSLESIVNRYDKQSAFHEVQFPLQRPRERPSNNNVELPLMSDIIDVLRWAKGKLFSCHH
ncbi:fungal specific transcription factor domain-containing protein [Phlyctema vagabunda]|uniref:Fungal specific transcription factor domain-containing protein n=1 Tax=Phlyctema vagabunda TaxID=108571 RepID=A0ABR4P9Y4_9HELO